MLYHGVIRSFLCNPVNSDLTIEESIHQPLITRKEEASGLTEYVMISRPLVFSWIVLHESTCALKR
jgi:hypothetical protein